MAIKIYDEPKYNLEITIKDEFEQEIKLDANFVMCRERSEYFEEELEGLINKYAI